MDTKWKILTDDKAEKYGISQADMYQMYAYHKRFENVKGVMLLYPSIDMGEKDTKENELQFITDNGQVKIYAEYLPFKNEDFEVEGVVKKAKEIVRNTQNTQNNVNL
jgi:5-methylcytosine-specific restriction enzyme subunit McrC